MGTVQTALHSYTQIHQQHFDALKQSNSRLQEYMLKKEGMLEMLQCNKVQLGILKCTKATTVWKSPPTFLLSSEILIGQTLSGD